MVTFSQRWSMIESALKDQAEVLGIYPDDIQKGNWQDDTVSRVPGIIVYLSPGDDLYTTTPPFPPTVATARVFCLASSPDGVHAAIDAAIGMGWKAASIINSLARDQNMFVRWDRERVRLDTVHSDYVVTLLRFVTYYDAP